TDTLMLGKRGRLVRSRWVSLAGDTIRSSKVLLSRQCLASDSIKRPARSKSPRRLILRRARGRTAWLTSQNIRAEPKIHVRPCGYHINRWRQSTSPPTSGGTSHTCSLKPGNLRASSSKDLSRSKKKPGHKARRVKQGGFTSGRRGEWAFVGFQCPWMR